MWYSIALYYEIEAISLAKRKKTLTINMSRDEVMAHEIGPIILATAKQCDLNLSHFRHVETLYKKNPNKDGVDYINSRFYNRDDNIELHTIFADVDQQDLWELQETWLDRYSIEDT